MSQKVHFVVMEQIDKKFSPSEDGNYHRITDQALYDLAQALGATQVQLASFHEMARFVPEDAAPLRR